MKCIPFFLRFLPRLGLMVFLFFVLFTSKLWASHGAGGEISFRCLGDSQFEFTLTFYKDCGPTAWAQINFNEFIFALDSDFEFALDVGINSGISMQRVSNDTLSVGLDINCLYPSEPYCLQRLVYRRVVELPFREGGYYFVGNFCCRNTSVNILGNEMVFFAHMPEEILLECNDGIIFEDWPPLFVCANEAYEFDHSVKNVIGDSISYRICAPLDGRRPNVMDAVWADGYSVGNPTGGDDPLKIDPLTGLISGTPIINGTFTVGVCVEEFRDGILIRSARRDVQFRVGTCLDFEADFFIPDLICGGGDLLVENLTREAKEYQWTLRDSDDVVALSQSQNPIFEIDDGGSYELRLVAIGDSDIVCVDTLTLEFDVLNFDYDLERIIHREGCEFPLELDINYVIEPDELFDLDYLLRLEIPGRSPVYSPSNSLVVTVPEVHLVALFFRAIDQNTGCWIFDISDYLVGAIVEDGFSDTVFICGEDYVELNEFFSPFNDYLWYPPDGMLDSVTTPNPRVRPLEPTTYTALVKNEFCEGEISYNVTLIPPVIPFLPDSICGTRTVELMYNPLTDFAQNFMWRFYMQNTLVGSRIGDNPTFTFPAYGEAEIELIPFRPIFPDCADTFRQTIYLYEPMVDLNVNYEKGVCSDSVEILLTVDILGDLGGTLEYILIINETDTFVSNSPDLSVWLDWRESHNAQLIVVSDHGCQAEEHFIIETELFPGLSGSESFEICRFDSLQLAVPVDSDFDFYWGDTTFFLSEGDSRTPIVIPDSSTVFELFILFDECEYLYTYEVEVQQPESFFLPDLLICDSTLSHQLFLPDIGDYQSVEWIIGEVSYPSFATSEENPLIDFEDFGVFALNLLVQDNSTCGSWYQGNVLLSDITRWDIKLDVLEKRCFGNAVELVLNGEVQGGLPGEGVDIFFIFNSVDTLEYDSTPLELSFKDLSEIGIELLIIDSIGCNQFEFKLLEFDLIDIGIFSDSMQLCVGDTIHLLPGANPDLSYVWSPAFGFISSLTEPNPLVSPDQSIQYLANIASTNCVTEQLVYVEVFPGPVIEGITADPQVLFEPGESFLNLDIVGEYIWIEWSPADNLDDPFIRNPVAFIEENTSFLVEVTDAFGCKVIAEITLFIESRPCEPPFVFIPNAFSPNGDGFNDVLYVRGEEILNMELRIYNRYGQLVFFSDDQYKGWDGTFQAEAMASGVYAYHLLVECTDGVMSELKGSISIIR